MSSTIIGGSRYRVICDLGRGGMANVQLALQSNRAGVERLVVIKRVRPELARDPEFAGMFLEEARIAASLSHQNVIQTYEVGQDEQGYLIVLEFLRGQAYSAILDAGHWDFRVSLEVLLGTLQGLEYAHALKNLSGREMALVHRDISPANIFVTYDGQVKLLDFGIAKTLDSTIETSTGMIKGKVSYMSPEQMRGKPADLRADLYAVGAMLWEATAGHQRFENALPDVAIVSLVSAQLASPTPTPGARERGLPGLADEICRRALAYDPEHRYESAEQFHDDLLKLIELVGGRMSPRILGQYLTDLFTVERRTLQQKIDTELEVWEQEKLAGLDSEQSLPVDRQVTRIIPQPVVGETPPPTSNFNRELPTAAALQADAARHVTTGLPWRWAAALAGVALLIAAYLVVTRRPSPTRLDDAKDLGRDTPTTAARANPVAADSATRPLASGAGGTVVSVTAVAQRLTPPGPSSPQTMKPSLSTSHSAAPRSGTALGPSPAGQKPESAGVRLDRGDPWAP